MCYFKKKFIVFFCMSRYCNLVEVFAYFNDDVFTVKIYDKSRRLYNTHAKSRKCCVFSCIYIFYVVLYIFKLNKYQASPNKLSLLLNIQIMFPLVNTHTHTHRRFPRKCLSKHYKRQAILYNFCDSMRHVRVMCTLDKF